MPIFCSEISLTKNLYLLETKSTDCRSNWLICFYMMQDLIEEPFRTCCISYNLCYQLVFSQCSICVETKLLIFTRKKYECYFKYTCSTFTLVFLKNYTNAKQETGFSINETLAVNGLSIINRLILFTVNISIVAIVTGIVCSTTSVLKM